MSNRETLLDACSLINLYATRRIAEILTGHPGQFCVVDVARREAGYVFRGGAGPDAAEREAIDLTRLEASGLLATLTAESEEELRTYIDLTLEMDDGEAMTGAIAIHRRFGVITDDRKALRILTERGVPCDTSLNVIKEWIEREHLAVEEVQGILLDIRQRARYLPHRTHPLCSWWDDALGQD